MGKDLFTLAVRNSEAVIAGDEQGLERVLTKTDGVVVHAQVSYNPDREHKSAMRGFFVLVTVISASIGESETAEKRETVPAVGRQTPTVF